MGLGFGHLNGPYPRLQSLLSEYEVGTGLAHVWRDFIAKADDQVLEDLLLALQSGSRTRNLVLASAICFGHDGMNRILSNDRAKLKRTARRFVYHAIATVDTVCKVNLIDEHSDASVNRRTSDHMIFVLQLSYQWLTPPSKSRPAGPLTQEESDLANAFCLMGGTGRNGEREELVIFLAENIKALESYWNYIAVHKEITVDGLKILLEVQPETALAAGAL